MLKREQWLSITPEPERELPWAVATLVHGARPPEHAVDAETRSLEALILHGSERRWLAYLGGVRQLIDSRADSADEDVAGARTRALAVLTNHDNLRLGLQARPRTRHRGAT